MEIGGGGNLYTIAPGTPSSPIKPELELTPEESNELVDQTLNRVDEAKEAEQASQDLTRQTFVGLVEAQLQQNNIERFIEASTDQDIDNESVGVSEIVDARQLNETATNVENLAARPEQDRLETVNASPVQEPPVEANPTAPHPNLTPEQTNNAVDRALDTINEFQATQQANQDQARQTVVGLVENQFQQENVERFIEASSGQDVENDTVNLNDLVQAQQRSQLAENSDSAPLRRDQDTQQDQLQERIENIVDDGPNIQPVIDLLV